MKEFEHKKSVSTEKNGGESTGEKSNDQKSPDSVSKESFLDKVKNKAKEIYQGFRTSIDGMKKSLKDRSAGQFENEEKEFEGEMGKIAKEGNDYTQEFEKRLSETKGREEIKTEMKSEGQDNKKEALAQEAKDLIRAFVEKRHAVTSNLLENRNEDGSVNLGNLVLSREEADEVMRSADRTKAETTFSTFGDINKLNENELAELISGVKTEDSLTTNESVKKDITDSIIEKRVHDEINEKKRELKTEFGKVEEKIRNLKNSVYESGNMAGAVTLKDLERDVLFLREKSEYIELGSIGIRGSEGMQKQNEKVLNQAEIVIVKLKEVDDLLNNIKPDSTNEEFSEAVGKIREVVKSIEKDFTVV